MEHLSRILKLIFVFSLIIFLPKTVLLYAPALESSNQISSKVMKYGVENISPKLLKKLKTKKWALICNHSSIDSQGKRTLDRLLKQNIRIIKIIAPEHGATGKYVAEHDVPDGKDELTKLPIYSAHKSGVGGRTIKDSILKDVDGIIFDIQDTGMRHYTYVSTLCEAIDSAQRNKKLVIVFDRPNPLGGLIDGPLVSEGYESFISRINIPLRHGLTLGECARYYNFYAHNNKAKLEVVPMLNYTRQYLASNLLVGLSPNIPDIRACHGYAFAGILGELSPLHIGIGTDKPFSLITLPEDLVPKYVWYQLRKELKSYGLDCMTTKCKKNNIPYYGLECKVNPAVTPTVPIIAAIVEALQAHNIKFKCGPALAKAFGNDYLHKFIDGNISRKEFVEHYKKDLNSFYKKLHSSNALLYEVAPVLYKL